MPSSTQAGPSPKSPTEHQWTFGQTYNLLDHILSNPKYIRDFFPTPGHTPAPGILQSYARAICLVILKDTAWMEGMKEHFEGGRLKFGRKWVGDDPVTIRLKELPELAGHYEERLGGNVRYEDIPPGSEYAKRWRKYERCPERKWVLKYFALKRIQSDPSMMVDSDSMVRVGTSISTPAPVKEKDVEGGDHALASKNGGGSKKRASLRPDPSLSSKRRKSAINAQETAKSSNVRSGNPDKEKEKVVIVISDSEEDETIPVRQTRRLPSPTFVDSDSESDSDSEDDGIRSVSPPIITLPSRSFALPPPDSPFRGTVPSPVRLAFQAPIDDTPTDSESEDEDTNPPTRVGVFSTIRLSTEEDLVGMFTDPKLRPQQAWRNGIPTPPDSRGSGSSSPIKSAGRRWDSALTPEPEAIVRAGTGADMDIETNLDHDSLERLDPVRPTTPPLPLATLGPNRSLIIQEHPSTARISHTQPGTPSYIDLSDDHRTTPPLPTHSIEQSAQPQSTPDVMGSDYIFHNPTDAEREIAARLLRTLTGDNQAPHEDITTSVAQYPQVPVHGETRTGALSDWIASHTGPPVTTQTSSAGKKGRERRPLLDRMAPGIYKGKGKQIELPTDQDPQIRETSIEAISYSGGTTKTSSTSTIQPKPAGPSTTPLPMDATSIHKATIQVSSSILNLLIAQTQLTSPLYLSGCVIAFAAGHIPFKAKLSEFVIALGGVVLEDYQVREMRGRRYIIHPVGEGDGGMDDGLEEVDLLGFLEIVGAKIGGSA